MNMNARGEFMTSVRIESDSMGNVDVPANKLWGSQTQRSLEHFSIGHDLIPREMITAYAVLKRSAAAANHSESRLSSEAYELITRVCDEILAGKHHDMFPLHVWMTGSGTQFNMNVNEVVSNRCCQLAGTPLGSKRPIHPNDHVNMSHEYRGRCPDQEPPHSGGNLTTRCHRGQGGGVEGHRENRQDAYAGCDAAHAWPGMVGLCDHAER
jgi:fumarate hydratase class II